MLERKQKAVADRPLPSRVLLLLLALLMSFMQVLPAWSQPAAEAGAGNQSISINWQICPPQPLCFHSVEARQAWAKEHNCRFLEDVCEKTTPDQDKQGATEADKGFWGDLWGKVSGALTYGYEFVKGLFAGLKDQIGDLIDLISNPLEVAEGLIELGKAFYDDPKGTLAMLAELLGQEAVDSITRATQCGAYDLGKIIGQYVSPAVMLKLATRLTQYGGKLSDAVRATRHDLGCASFVAGTPIHTGQGTQAIERIGVGALVSSRDEWRWSETPQRVDNTFKRTAPGYRELRTEFETYRVTDEHPLWVQGKGWTEARHVTDEDVLGSLEGDALVRENRAVAEPVEVYNFSVANTPNYFVGEAGLWVHNAKCDLTRVSDIRDTALGLLGALQKGFKGELIVRETLEAKGYTVVSAVGKHDGAFEAWQGKKGIDGIFKDPQGNYVIVESKTTGGIKPSDPEGCVAKLCQTQNNGRQMSREWIENNLKDSVPDPAEREAILEAIKKGEVKKVYAQTDANGTTFHEVIDVAGDRKAVKLGGQLHL